MAKPKIDRKIEQTDAFRDAISEIYKPPDHDARRRAILKKLEKRWGAGTKIISYMGNPVSPYAILSPGDVGPIASALQKLGHVKRLLFLINSSGGDAYTAQKIIDVCRSHCKRFIVAVPDRAKSAATLICLGADEIVMGYLSELGPIDPQVRVIVSGESHQVSANSFIEAKRSLEKSISQKQTDGEVTLPYLQELSGLDIAFVRECERMSDWSSQLAINYLSKHMLAKRGITKASAREKAYKIARNLSTEHLQHGELIGPAACKKMGLEINRLRKNDRKWRLLWDYYVRVAVYFTLPQDGRAAHISKIFETVDATLSAQSPSR